MVFVFFKEFFMRKIVALGVLFALISTGAFAGKFASYEAMVSAGKSGQFVKEGQPSPYVKQGTPSPELMALLNKESQPASTGWSLASLFGGKTTTRVVGKNYLTPAQPSRFVTVIDRNGDMGTPGARVNQTALFAAIAAKGTAIATAPVAPAEETTSVEEVVATATPAVEITHAPAPKVEQVEATASPAPAPQAEVKPEVKTSGVKVSFAPAPQAGVKKTSAQKAEKTTQGVVKIASSKEEATVYVTNPLTGGRVTITFN
jgi:hypothetical protein